MARRLSKLSSKILVPSIVVFIFLSGSIVTQEATRCYWCGPLAEQVHRSLRSPPCDPFHHHQTVCDDGYTHCAIIASSPPYAESRLCVKLYQDECYSKFCNSTKTWRMVCACRGNLCNGNHSEREIEAFAAIAKRTTVASTRIKRALMAGFISVKTKGPSENNTIIIIQNKTDSNMQGDQPHEDINATSHKTNEAKHAEDNIIIEHGNKKENQLAHDKNTNIQSTNHDNKNEEIIINPTEKHEDKTIEMTKEDVKSTNVESVSTKPSTEIEVSIQTTSDKMPPAEALLNITPTRAMEMVTVTVVTEANVETTPMISTTSKTNETKKNIGTKILSHILMYVTILSLHFCL